MEADTDAACTMDETFMSFTDEELTAHEVQIKQKLEVIEQKIDRLKAQKNQLLKWKDTIQNVRRQRKMNQRANRDWDDENFTWSTEAKQALKEVFCLHDFRPRQLRTINALLSGNDIILLAPTGGGKSLCFQLPAVISEGLTVVISPLISLMEDQVWSMRKLCVEAKLLCSSTEKAQISQILKELSDKQKPTLKILYVTPERMSKSKRFMSSLQKCYNNGHLDRFAIDEVHCCSQWGHDFRPDYKYLGVLKEMFPKAPLLGVTATATTKVIADVQKILNIPEALLFVASFNRPNLYYHVLDKPHDKQDQYELLSNLLLNRFRKQSGIIYTFSMKDAVDISSELRERGLKVAPYHASLEQVDRTKIHQMWLKNQLQAVVATVAFGMGINKSDVRFVIHHTMSKSLENFYQESGRAGRDGQRAECILLYHYSDIFRISTMTFSEHTGLKNAYAMVEYCINVSECRRKIISRYFSEVWGGEDCSSMCDRCKNIEQALPPKLDVFLIYEQLKRIIVKASMENIKLTGLRLVDAWMHKGPAFLRLPEPPPLLDRAVAEQIVAFLIINCNLKESFTYTPYATISYIIQGLPVLNNSLMVRVGKLFALPDIPSGKGAMINHRKSQTKGKNVVKKRPTAATPKKRINNTTSAETMAKDTKRARSEPLVEVEKRITPPPANNEEDIVILSACEDVIEIEGD